MKNRRETDSGGETTEKYTLNSIKEAVVKLKVKLSVNTKDIED